MTPIRILHLTKSIGFYGADKVILHLYDTHNRDRYALCVGAFVHPSHPHRELVDAVLHRGGDAIAIDCRKRIDSRALQNLMSFIREQDIHILHCHEIKSRLYGLIAAKYLRLPVLATNHNWIRGSLAIGAYEVLDALYLRFFDHIIAVSDQVRQSMLQFRIPPGLISVVTNGINLKEYDTRHATNRYFRQALGIHNDAPVIGAVGRLSTEKGYPFFLSAAKDVLAQIPDAWFLVVGDGSLRHRLQQYARQLKIDTRVIFAGFRNDIVDLYSVMDVYVLSSLREGTPIALLEAMAMGVPAIATDVGGVSRIISPNYNGVLVPPQDSHAISNAILHLLTNPQEAAKLARHAKGTVAIQYSAESMARDYEHIYDKILIGSQRHSSIRSPSVSRSDGP